MLHEFAGDAKDLEGEFAGGRDDDDAGAVSGLEAQGAEDLDGGNEEGERFSRARLGRAQHVLAGEEGRNGLEGESSVSRRPDRGWEVHERCVEWWSSLKSPYR